MGLDASRRRLLSQNRAVANELELHIEVLRLMWNVIQQQCCRAWPSWQCTSL